MSCSRQFSAADIHGALETLNSNMSRDVIEEMVFNEVQAEQNILNMESTPTLIC